MKKLLFISFIFQSLMLLAQEEFSFQLYFEDKFGHKDTVTVGHDLFATNGIDSLFGEVDIAHIPWKDTFKSVWEMPSWTMSVFRYIRI